MAKPARDTVVVTYPGFDLRDHRTGGRLREAGLSVRFVPRSSERSPSDVSQLMQGAAAGIVSTDPFDASVFKSCPELRVLARVGVGLDSIDVSSATAAGVVVTTTRGLNAATVADHCLALMLAAIRHVVANDQSVRRSEWDRGGAWIGGDLYGATIGLVGLGAIGRMVAQRLSGFDVKIIGHDPVRVDVANVEWSTLGELLRQADVVSLHTPLTPATQGMIGLRELRLMGSDAILINTSRGAIVDEPSLVKALSSGWIRGAGLDVFMNEPPLNSALLEMSNVVLSPHVAGVSVRTQQAMIERAVSSVIDVVAGGASEDAVNPDALTRV